MSQQRVDHRQSGPGTVECVEETDSQHSSMATVGSSSSSSAPVLAQPHIRYQAPRRPITRGLAQNIQVHQKHRQEAVSSRVDILKWNDNQIDVFRGLTLDPLPSAMVPSRKRSLSTILADDSPPRKDKLTEEIDQIARDSDGSYGLASDGPKTRGGYSNQSPQDHRKKRTRTTERADIPRTMPGDGLFQHRNGNFSENLGEVSSQHLADVEVDQGRYSASSHNG
ncbi:hypothetical protein F5Y15DRAFT_400156 [Xylariaceae sp. FL0016]|nr:hypothetical protein F5Y15DRAFT_400156 [Xylariaceae sp. FL0016]